MNHVRYRDLGERETERERERQKQSRKVRQTDGQTDIRTTRVCVCVCAREMIRCYIIRISSLLYVSFVTHFVVILNSHTHTYIYILHLNVCVDNKETWVSGQTRPDARLQHRVSLTLGLRSISTLYYIHSTAHIIRDDAIYLDDTPQKINYILTSVRIYIYCMQSISATDLWTKVPFSSRRRDCTHRVPPAVLYSYRNSTDK